MANQIYSYLKSHEGEIFDDLKELVRAEATSADLEELKTVRAVLIRLIRERTGVTPEVHRTPGGHDPLSFAWGQGDKDILLVGHFDTVIPIGSYALREEDGKLYGAGVLDMKAGLVSILWILKAYRDLGIAPAKRLKVLMNCDEEIGSADSAPLIMEMARDNSAAALILEPCASSGDLKTGRKGGGGFTVKTYGKASHAGLEHKLGINAIEELAREIQYIHSLTDYEKGSTLSADVITGGTKRNVVADFAQVDVDFRYSSPAEYERIRQLIADYQPTVAGATREVLFGKCVPPMEQTPENLKLFALAEEAGKEVGLTFSHVFVGGISDGNPIAPYLPVLDGLGPHGDGAHTLTEFIYTDQLIPRIAMVGNLILKI